MMMISVLILIDHAPHALSIGVVSAVSISWVNIRYLLARSVITKRAMHMMTLRFHLFFPIKDIR